MAANDETPIVSQLSPNEIADAIRHKKFGADMREALAQGFEYMNSWWTQVSSLNDEVQTLGQRIADLSQQHSQDIQSLQTQYSNLAEENKNLNFALNQLDGQFIDFQKEYYSKVDDYDKRLKKLEDAIYGTGSPVDTSSDFFYQGNDDMKAMEVKLD